jgi:hypothetical protein
VKGSVEGDIRVNFAESNSPSEITIIALNFWMAARFAACVKKLKERYDEKISGSSDTAAAYRYFCHLHDTYGITPDIFPLPGDALRLSFKAYICIGKHLGLIQIADSGVIFLVKEKDGLPSPEEIATSAVALEALTDVTMNELRAEMRQGAVSRQREEFNRLLDAEHKKLRACLVEECGNQPTHQKYRTALVNYEALKKAVEEIKGEA